MKTVRAFILAVVMMTVPFIAFADVFDIHIEADGYADPFTQSFKSLENMIDELDADQIAEHFAGYDEDNTGANATLNFRGVPVYVSFPTGQAVLNLSIPSIDFTKSFVGTDRDDAVDQLQDWFEKDGGSTLTRLQKELVSETPSDPIAGNPTSLMGRMVSMEFDSAFRSDTVVETNTAAKPEINANMISVFARYSNYKIGNVKSSEYSLPLAYTIRFNNSKNTLSIRIPISYMDVEGSQVANLGLGLAFGYHVNDNWKLTPSIGYGAVGSIDLGSVGQIVSTSLTSSYTFNLGKYKLSMGNMVGHYQTIPFSYGDYDFDPDIQNTVFRNGFNFVVPVNAEKGTTAEFFITDTRYIGSDLYVDAYNEVGFSYGFDKGTTKETAKGIKSLRNNVRVGLTYLFADETDGITVNAGFAF